MKCFAPAALFCAMLASVPAQADEPALPAGDVVEFFAAIEAGQIEAQFIAKNENEANVLIQNKMDRPLNIQLPQAFAGVPVLAQFGGGGGGLGGGGGGGSQGVGGGMGGMGGGGMGGMGGGGGGGFFNLPPERLKKVEVATVCLDHGKPEPRAAIAYKIVPLENYAADPALGVLMEVFGNGKLNQRSVQAAAWHIRNNMSWQELASKEIRRANGARYPYFSRAELQLAMGYVRQSEIIAKQRESEQKSPGEVATESLLSQQ